MQTARVDPPAARRKVRLTDSPLRPAERPFAVWPLLALLAVLSLAGFLGGISLVRDPTGDALQAKLSWLDQTPVHDFLLPGLFLLVAFGIGALVMIIGLVSRVSPGPLHRLDARIGLHWAWLGTIALGAVLVLWIVYELFVISGWMWLQPVLIGFGLLMIALPLLPSMRRWYATSGSHSIA